MHTVNGCSYCKSLNATAIPCGQQTKLYVPPLYASGYSYAEA